LIILCKTVLDKIKRRLYYGFDSLGTRNRLAALNCPRNKKAIAFQGNSFFK